MSEEVLQFWEGAEQVERFASLAPDKRVISKIANFADPSSISVLELGCAGGRNVALLAEKGFIFHAIDRSRAMVEKSRERAAEFIGGESASLCIRTGRMECLHQFADGSFNLVIALGIYQNAQNRTLWMQALLETARVLKTGGEAIVSNFSPRSKPLGVPLTVSGHGNNLYEGFGPGRLYLVEAGEIDRDMAVCGLQPVFPTETVSVPTESGCRVTINGHYGKTGTRG